MGQVSYIRLQPVEYAVYGVLMAAKWETGPEGARRVYRIEDRLDFRWGTGEIEAALQHLIHLGLVQRLPEILGMVHYQGFSVIEDNGQL